MGTLLQSTLNTRALPTGNLRYVRSDYPGKLTDQEVKWLLQNDYLPGGSCELYRPLEAEKKRSKRLFSQLWMACLQRSFNKQLNKSRGV